MLIAELSEYLVRAVGGAIVDDDQLPREADRVARRLDLPGQVAQAVTLFEHGHHHREPGSAIRVERRGGLVIRRLGHLHDRAEDRTRPSPGGRPATPAGAARTPRS